MDKVFLYLTDLSGGVAYAIIFGILVACGMGFPLPEDIPLIAAGYLIWDETTTWIPSLIVAMLGVLIGDTILFHLGQKLGFRILRRPEVERVFKPEKVRRVRAYFRKYGMKVVFFARFVAGFRSIAFFMSGAMHMKYRKFISLDSLAACISVPVWIGIGYAFGYFIGDDVERILKDMHELKVVLMVVMLAVVIFALVRSYRRYQRARQSPSSY